MTTEQPTRTARDDIHGRYDENHPGYGVIGASRVQSSQGHHLFGSDFRHHNYVVIEVKPAMMTRDLSSDWVHTRHAPDIVEVALSEAQWATFVSSMNMGIGVPCTISRDHGVAVPGIEPLDDRREQFTDEVREHLDATIADLVALRDAATTKKIRVAVERILRDLQSNLPYVAKRFDEHAEATVEKAKVEVNAYLTQMVQRAGLAAIASGEAPPIALDTSEYPEDGGDRYAGMRGEDR